MSSQEIVETGITISDWLMMLAVILGPILAVQIQKVVERRKEDRERRLKVFRDLMTTRAATLAFQHVSALNMVGLEFNGKNTPKLLVLGKPIWITLVLFRMMTKGVKKFGQRRKMISFPICFMKWVNH